MPDEHEGRGDRERTVPLTIRLSPEHARALSGLAELYHATPERMVAAWAAHHIDRLTADLTADSDRTAREEDPPASALL